MKAGTGLLSPAAVTVGGGVSDPATVSELFVPEIN